MASSKLFEANTPEGVTLRRAIAAARDAQFLSRTSKAAPFRAGGDGYFGPAGKPGRATLSPRVSGGADARAVNNPKSALDQLMALVDEQRAADPTLSEAGAFAMVYSDPKNADLAARERAENRPTAQWVIRGVYHGWKRRPRPSHGDKSASVAG